MKKEPEFYLSSYALETENKVKINFNKKIGIADKNTFIIKFADGTKIAFDSQKKFDEFIIKHKCSDDKIA